jgi:predicted site-specific integrase-resolvase
MMPSANGHGPKRAIFYARVSTDEQAGSGYSLAQQLEALRDYASRESYEVLEEVADPGQSGASLERDLVVAGGVSMVLAQDRDRIAREPAYHYLLRKEFEEHGTKIRALNDRGDDSPEGELTDGILDQLAKYERAKIAERSRRGKLRKAREDEVEAELELGVAVGLFEGGRLEQARLVFGRAGTITFGIQGEALDLGERVPDGVARKRPEGVQSWYRAEYTDGRRKGCGAAPSAARGCRVPSRVLRDGARRSF